MTITNPFYDVQKISYELMISLTYLHKSFTKSTQIVANATRFCILRNPFIENEIKIVRLAGSQHTHKFRSRVFGDE